MPQAPKRRGKSQVSQKKITHLEILIRHLLVLGIHGFRRRASLRSDGEEDDKGDADADEGGPNDLEGLVGRGKGTGTVGTESNPVCWREKGEVVLARVCGGV